ncbi:hypothetical protein CPB83DRAFT_855656 [Crepidotus variabilis]|uniref:LCCL domain-containing protein n=1 Tax=Crepidotus variabilis TaxID=179855 RepID=A0A9P6JPQ0_9AGAR|nr:hypothetical protein CPB83DRAFT_855656 [Crepidotus variabilis]
MAAPADLTILNLSGKFYLNKTKTDATKMDEVLRLQGVSWMTRKIIGASSITLHIKHYKDDAGVEHIDIDQTLTGGISGTREERTLWWKEHEHEDHIFGSVLGKSRRVKADELDEPFLKTGWTADTLEHGLVQAYAESNTAKSNTTWIANQTWGLEEFEGERRYIRHLKFTGPGAEEIEVKFIYDYAGPLSS